MRATVITDASFCARTQAGGWAAWIRFENNLLIRLSAEFRERPADSTEAEAKAALNGVVRAQREGATQVLLQTDCMAVVTGLSLWAKRLGVPIHCRVTSRHIKGHNGGRTARSWVNEWCDREAKKHMRAMRDRVDDGPEDSTPLIEE